MSDTKTKKEKKTLTKYQKAKKRRKIINTLMGIIVFCALLGVVSGISTVALVLHKSDVDLEIEDLNSKDSSIIYDDSGNQIAMLGQEDRINVSYNDMPQCVIDAFVAVEDSRFFEHSGFDLPRFTKAILTNLRSLSFAQGGSTVTMQVIKNTYFAVDTIAASDVEDGIPRKIQEIYYSIKITNKVSKEKILELYINKVNYGSNARGIQVASKYYFNKDVSEVTLVEAALLAGVINGPNAYNPYYHPEACQSRTNTVLYQMYNHGYITKEEYDVAKAVDVIDLLAGKQVRQYVDGQTIPNQAYIDAVISELEDVYDIDPYTTAVRVYTGMNQTVQTACDEISNGDLLTYKDEYCNYAAAIVQNYTGLVVGLCGGRNYDSARRFNYATDGRMQPGSTAKPVLAYPLAFEYAGYSYGSYVYDEPITWAGTNITIMNDFTGYQKWVSLQKAFTYSTNVPAVKILRDVEQTAGITRIKQYLRDIGLDEFVASNYNEQYALGGTNFIVSPLQMASATSVILSGGKYTPPHTITKIEFINSTKEPIIPSFSSQQVLSSGAAWLTSQLMRLYTSTKTVTERDGVALPRTYRLQQGRDYETYSKTGSSSLPDVFRKKYKNIWGFKDLWLLGGTNDFSIAGWYGYDYNNGMERNMYMSTKDRSSKVDIRFMNHMLNALETAYGKPRNTNNKPSDVVSFSHIRGYMPFSSLPSYADPKYAASDMILSKFASVEEWKTPDSIASVENLDVTLKTPTELSISFSPYPDPSKLEPTPEEEMGYTKPSDIDGVIRYYVNIYDDNNNLLYSNALDTNTLSYKAQQRDDDYTITVTVRYQYTICGVQSNTLSKTVTIVGTHPEPEPEPEPELGPVEP